MEKIWLKHYPPGVPAEINPDQYQSLVELFEQSCGKFADLPSFYNLGVTLSYRELNTLSQAFAAYLQQGLRLVKGARIAIMLPNLLHYPVVLFGALRAGLVVVNVNPLYTAHELKHQLKDAGAETIIVLENFAHTVQEAFAETQLKQVIIARVGDFFSPLKALVAQFILKYVQRKVPAWQLPGALYFKAVLETGKKLSFEPPSLKAEDLAFLQYTGGTTGVAKGAMLTHRNILANIEQGYAWFQSQFHLGKEVVLTALPLYHVFSLTVNCLLYATKVGGLNVLITNPRDVPKMLSEMEKFKFSCITGVNTLFQALLRSPRFALQDFSRLRLTVGGGMAVQRRVAEQWQVLTGSVLLEGYGLTEASPCVSMNPPDSKFFSGDIGLPLPSTEVCILDDQGRECPPGQGGELAVRGPQVIKGFWRQPEESKRAFTQDGWLLTGDVAVLDEEGRLHILDRKKDMILVSGFNVYPNEVEDVIAAIPGVAEVAVVGVPDTSSGEVVKAFVIKNQESLTAEELIQHCRMELAAYKVPKQVEFCKDLPKSYVGKILRRALRD